MWKKYIKDENWLKSIRLMLLIVILMWTTKIETNCVYFHLIDRYTFTECEIKRRHFPICNEKQLVLTRSYLLWTLQQKLVYFILWDWFMA